jgi:L-aspartate oxidase
VDELLPRDVVAKAIKNEMLKEGTDYVYLSLENLDSEKIKTRFPNIYQHCLEEGYDITKEYIPVIPAQHYFMGGIEVDLTGKTSMKNLFAIGETSCNGVHGRNRLGSNSLLESVVFSKRCAKYIAENIQSIIPDIIPVDVKSYDYENLKQYYKQLILNEIKRRDAKFYEQWFSNEN